MSWRTRNIRRRNKGKKTKGRKQKGGGFGGPSLDEIIKHLIKTSPDEGIPVHMETNGMVKNSPFLGPFKIKFTGQNKFVIITPPDGFKEGIENQYRYSISGSSIKKIVITGDNLAKKAVLHVRSITKQY